MAEPNFPCAAVELSSRSCQKEGRSACGNCFLVLYCGPECQKAHWPQHKKYCKSPLRNEGWQPGWLLENRPPAFMGGGSSPVPFGQVKYLWGNVPALDVLQLRRNEGEAYDKDIGVLFAASGDMRNAVKTVAGIPNTFQKSVNIVINDKDLHVVARNAIMLFVAAALDLTPHEAVECLLHIWYSAKITESHSDILESKIRPLIREVCDKISDKLPGAVLAKTWVFGTCRIRLVLTKESWLALDDFFKVPEGLKAEKADDIRTAVTLAPDRRDYKERRWLLMKPEHRVCAERYRDDGVLLPFGHSRNSFTEPNPTIFRNANAWPFMDSSDPMSGWDIADVLATPTRGARLDLYGKFYHHVISILTTFREKLQSLDIDFHLYNVSAEDLPPYLEKKSFARIDTSNICDAGYLGAPTTLAHLSPLLQSQNDNPNATIVMLFINALHEMSTPMDDREALRAAIPQLSQRRESPVPMQHFAIFSFAARSFFLDADEIFRRYMDIFQFDGLGLHLGMGIKNEHTIVDKWPMGLKKRVGEAGVKEEFEMLMGTGYLGTERYVEWKRIE